MLHTPLRFTLLSLLILLLCAPSHAADNDPVVYTISLRQPQTQMVDITMSLPINVNEEGDKQTTIDVLMPTWRIGRYSILDFAGAVRGVAATDHNNNPLDIEKIRKSTWRITLSEDTTTVNVAYRIYANEGNLRTRHVDDTHAFLSGTSVFMYSDQHRDRPCTVQIDRPVHWQIATGLESTNGDPRIRNAPNYDVLVDSPFEIGVHDKWTFDVRGVPHEIILWPAGLDVDEQRLIDDFTAIVETQHDIFHTFPYERYVFLIHAGLGGGGTEHLNSTIMQTSVSNMEASVGNRDAWKRFLALVAHEFFHTWNVKALRPAGLVPYDYQSENYTTLLWVAEGTTSYYDDLTLPRAGLMKPAAYLKRMSGSINSIKNRPGASIQSASASSFDAWIKFNHGSPDDINSEVSFYTKGAQLSMYLDLLVRTRTENLFSLDDVMRIMYERFPLSTGGYTEANLRSVLAEVSGDNMDEFFANHVNDTQPLPWNDVLPVVGLELYLKYKPDPRRPADDDDDDETSDDSNNEDDTETEDDTPVRTRATLGLSLSTQNNRAVVRHVLSNGPAYDAGLQPGDEIIAINNKRVRASDLDSTLRIKHMPGETLEVVYMRRDDLKQCRITLTAIPDASWTLRKIKDPTDLQKATYEAWVGHPW